MEEFENVETQEVVEPVENQIESQETNEEVVQNEQVFEQVEDTQQVISRDYQRDSAYAQMRREKEQLQKQLNNTRQVLQKFGFVGENFEDVLDQANAHYEGRPVDEIRQDRIAREQKEQQESLLQQKIDYYEEKEIQANMQRDLEEIQKINPNIKSLEELGDKFVDYLSKGINGLDAYKLLELNGLVAKQNQNIEQQTIRKISANNQSSVGSLNNGADNQILDYENMSSKDFEKIYQRALRGELKKY